MLYFQLLLSYPFSVILYTHFLTLWLSKMLKNFFDLCPDLRYKKGQCGDENDNFSEKIMKKCDKFIIFMFFKILSNEIQL